MPARAFRRELRFSYFAPFLGMALLAGVVMWRVRSQVVLVTWVDHTYQVIREIGYAQNDLLKITVAARSYLLAPDKGELAALQDAEKNLDSTIAMLSSLIVDNTAQGQRLIRATSLKGGWLETIQILIAQKNSGGGQTIFLPIVQLDDQRQAVSKILDSMVEEEDRLLHQRSIQRLNEDRLIFLLVPLLSALTAAALSYWGWHEIVKASEKFAAALTNAEEASRLNHNFLASISHELRNPLNSILLLSTVLLSDPELSENVRQRVTAIERSARIQAQLIEDLLDASRLGSGQMRLDVQTTDLAQVVKAAVDGLRVAAEAKSIALQDIVDPQVNLIAGDPKRLQQVVWNLVSNAIKFTSKGGKVQVRLERINSHVEIVIADNGQGLASSSLPHVFDRFWQDKEATQNGGAGLGLAIVKELVALHGGTVMAHSDGPGHGSTFTVRLPLPVSTTPVLESRRHPTVAPIENVATAPRLDGLALLVVDDDQEACDALTRLLGWLGASVTAATSAQGGLAKLDRVHPDAIVADIGMPVEDGYFFARELRMREQQGRISRRVPLIALTAYGRVEDKVKILAGGFDSHVVKPVDLAELAATIRSLVASRGI
jgi:signal transduction histidine kinase/CheY-like chemotaxis protein